MKDEFLEWVDEHRMEGLGVFLFLLLISIIVSLFGKAIRLNQTELVVWDQDERKIYSEERHSCRKKRVIDTIEKTFKSRDIDMLWTSCGPDSKTEVFLVPKKTAKMKTETEEPR